MPRSRRRGRRASSHPTRESLCGPPQEATLAGVVPSWVGSARRRARPDSRLRQPTSSKREELEDTSVLGGLHRIVEIDPIEGADEPDPERYASGERTEDIAKERDSLCQVQLGGGDRFFAAAHGDGCVVGSA